jgi:hypothetical protein
MGLGHKQFFTGTVKKDKGGIVLDTGAGPAIELLMGGSNPAADRTALSTLLGKRVEVEGIPGSGHQLLVVDGLSAFKVLPPPNAPKPPQP